MPAARIAAARELAQRIHMLLHPPSQNADVAVLELPLGPEGDLDGLFAVGGGKPFVVEGCVDDPEVDLRLGPLRLASNTVTSAGLYSRKASRKALRGVQLT